MVNFTFVSHKGARPEKSELVKSHVMRESQKRRREARQRRQYEISLTNDRASSRSTVGQVESPRQRKVAPHPLPFRSLPHPGSPNHENQHQDDRSLTPPSEAISVVQAGFRLDADGRLHTPAHTLVPQPRIVVPQLQHLTDPYDPASMPESYFNRVNEIITHYFVSFEDCGPDPTSTITHWFRQPRVSPLILLTYSLFYCAHRDLIIGIIGNDHDYFKVRNLQLINAAFQDPATALSDETILAVIGMAHYENIRGSNLVITHGRGLRQMFDLRGGLNNFMAEKGLYIGNFAILLDYLQSTCSNREPFFFDTTGPVLCDLQSGNRKTFFPQSPLRVLNGPGFPSSIPVPELRSSIDILRDAFDAFEMLCVEVFDPETAAREASRFKFRREKFWMRMQRHDSAEDEGIPPTMEGKAQEAIELAGKIHFSAVVSRIQHEDEINTTYVTRLHNVLKKLSLNFWKPAPYVYIWILLTGGAASSRLPDHRPYFVSELMRVSIAIGFHDWQSFKQTQNNFLWLQDFLRKNAQGLPWSSKQRQRRESGDANATGSGEGGEATNSAPRFGRFGVGLAEGLLERQTLRTQQQPL